MWAQMSAEELRATVEAIDEIAVVGLVLLAIAMAVAGFVTLLANVNFSAIGAKKQTDDEIIAEINRTTPRISDEQIQRIIDAEKERERRERR